MSNSKKQTDEYRPDPTRTFVERTGNFEIFKDTTGKDGTKYFYVSLLDGKEGAKTPNLGALHATVQGLNILAGKKTTNENCLLCGEKAECKKTGDEKLNCKDPVPMSENANPFFMM
jgi:hypothetical protein